MSPSYDKDLSKIEQGSSLDSFLGVFLVAIAEKAEGFKEPKP